VPQVAHVIEFALVRLRYRFGASIDDILLDPELGDRFEDLASALAPGFKSEDFRLGALYIRKTRHFQKKDLQMIPTIKMESAERAWTPAVTLSRLRLEEVPQGRGLIELRESGRYLYIARNEDLRPVAEQLRRGTAFELVANEFWTPRLDAITIQFIPGSTLANVGMGLWERLLISNREPILNWPVVKKAA
jgi:hypothetical protein